MIHRTHTAQRHVRIFSSFLPVLLLCFSAQISLFAAATTPEQAKAVVSGWLMGNNTPLGTALNQQIKDVKTFKDDGGATLHYVVSLNPSGFVVVSADDLIEPIIAFAKAGSYNPSVTTPLGALVRQDMKGRMAVAKNAAAGRGAVPEQRIAQ